ncbi:hypothetical protein DM55_3621 [Burkholderia mallei]|uniref:hypothetical protein n=1 Tax=Burkholderia mallei TaxID=13373 RepID=UPI0004F8A9A4|nr:hypothetical protein [Burkholderia mallei]AIO54245.1 hypothetical protein DM55_3621 [Burkholderia mallei]
MYAIGYNWLQSNEKSARDVIEGMDFDDKKTDKKMRLMGIKEIIAENDSGKAIILIHSMGGLVACMAIAMHSAADLMHGVFHNVLPATGAPIAAKRFRTGGGSEGGLNGFINGALLGSNADEFVVMAANAPGALELLPMPDYHNGVDLPPTNRASRSLVKFVFGEEDEHEEALYGTANYRVSEGSRGRYAGQGTVQEAWVQ